MSVFYIPKQQRDISKANSNLSLQLVLTLISILIGFSFLLIKSFELSILNSAAYVDMSKNNILGKEPIWGERGIIYDRNGKVLVENIKSYELYVNPAIITKEQALKHLSSYSEKLTEIYKTPEYVDILVAQNIPKEIVVAIKEAHPVGITIKYSYARNYLYSQQFAHILGYTGIASENDLKNNSNLLRNQILGKTGLEYQYNKELQGELKYLTVERDAYGNEFSSTYFVPPLQGKNLTLTVDINAQKAMFNAVKKAVNSKKAKGGAGVLIDVTSGEILAIASYPSYDPNLFINGISQNDYNKIINSPQTPLLHRAIASQQPPGSTFKVIVAAGALNTGAISKNTIIYAPGVIRLSGGAPFQDYKKHVYGSLTVKDALMVSSNIFFCKTALKLGIDKLDDYAKTFGIGELTNVDLPGEMPGRLPSPENKIALSKAGATWLDPIWYPDGDTCNSAIGQGITLATPIQMATVASIVANGGTYYKPHIVKQIGTKEKTPLIVQDNVADEAVFKTIQEGMRMSVSGSRGVATALRYVPMAVAAKTGTAEFGIKDKDGYSTAHAWVIGFYPYNEPKYAFAMLIEGAGSSSVATFAMRDFLNSYK